METQHCHLERFCLPKLSCKVLGLLENQKISFHSLLEWWDYGKERIKGLAIHFCNEKQSERRQSSSLLLTLATHLKFKIDNGTVSLLDVYERVLGKIAELDHSATEGAHVRSRIRWAEEGETSSHFFLHLERKAVSDNWIPMCRVDGSVAADIGSICSSSVHFYSVLFIAGEIDFSAQDNLLSNLSAQLPNDVRAHCEGLLSSHEVLTALKGMAHNMSPGSEGLPMEFFLSFWATLGSDLVEVLNSFFKIGSLPSSQKALISLIFKKGDRLEHKNWGTISLLNVDYKLCARASAGRLLGVLHHIIAPDQTWCVGISLAKTLLYSETLCISPLRQRLLLQSCHLFRERHFIELIGLFLLKSLNIRKTHRFLMTLLWSRVLPSSQFADDSLTGLTIADPSKSEVEEDPVHGSLLNEARLCWRLTLKAF